MRFVKLFRIILSNYFGAGKNISTNAQHKKTGKIKITHKIATTALRLNA